MMVDTKVIISERKSMKLAWNHSLSLREIPLLDKQYKGHIM